MTPMRVALMIGGCWVIPTFISFLPIMQGWNSIGIDHLVSAPGLKSVWEWKSSWRWLLFFFFCKFVAVKTGAVWTRHKEKTKQMEKKVKQSMFYINRKKMGFWEVLFTRRKKCSMCCCGNNNNISDTETDGRGRWHHRHGVEPFPNASEIGTLAVLCLISAMMQKKRRQ